jgi:hypothetical protein
MHDLWALQASGMTNGKFVPGRRSSCAREPSIIRGAITSNGPYAAPGREDVGRHLGVSGILP